MSFSSVGGAVPTSGVVHLLVARRVGLVAVRNGTALVHAVEEEKGGPSIAARYSGRVRRLFGGA